MQRFALKYRPKTFAQMRGQDHPKRVISQLILNGRSCENLLLHGSIGSGKTSFVRIYAMALNCDQPAALGDCCFRCDSCIAAANESARARGKHEISTSGLEELDAPGFRDFDLLKDRLDLLLEQPIPAGKRRVIFTDEAHALSRYRDSFDYFLKRVRRVSAKRLFLFCDHSIGTDFSSPALSDLRAERCAPNSCTEPRPSHQGVRRRRSCDSS